MLTAHLEAGLVTMRDVDVPVRPPGFGLIRLLCAGVCNTDLELQRGYYGFSGTPGHEFVGVVAEAGDAALVGRRVVGEINLACGTCEWCRRGLGRHCPNRTVLGIVKHPGVFSEYFTLPEGNLHAVPETVPTDHAVFTEPLAAACEILDQVAIPPGAEAAVLGDGKLGLLTALVLHAHGARVRLYGRHESKLCIARDAGIETHAGASLPEARYDWVVEATGSADGLHQAAAMTRPRGTVILKSTVHNAVAIDTAPIVVNEITLVGSRCGRFEPALELLETGTLPLDRMIADRFPLAETPRAFERAAGRGVLKVLVEAPRA
ncbi:MAG TPA: alcohol dehydrogenase catalytic domain-containing protein [Bryobacteraceae bacterium]|nr:alcohol dehydrogenase catalytic domain-containing protein [Bryobacteraceae bacterium]